MSWGFVAEHDSNAPGELIERFVAYLVPDDILYPPRSLHDRQRYCQDFLRGLYLHIKSYFIDNPTTVEHSQG